MKISALIAYLQRGMRLYGDLPIYSSDADIGEVIVHPCRDGVVRTRDGVLDDPNELVIEFIPAR